MSQTIEQQIALKTAQADLALLRKNREATALAVDQARQHYDAVCQRIVELQDTIITLQESP